MNSIQRETLAAKALLEAIDERVESQLEAEGYHTQSHESIDRRVELESTFGRFRAQEQKRQCEERLIKWGLNVIRYHPKRPTEITDEMLEQFQTSPGRHAVRHKLVDLFAKLDVADLPQELREDTDAVVNGHVHSLDVS